MRLFCVSDIHSFFTPFKNALDNAGFEADNKDHLLVVLGDIWDRGSESYEVMQYLDDLSNVVLIRGNHEDLLEEMLNRGYGEKHDIDNSTVWTVCQLADGAGVEVKGTYEICKAVEDFTKSFLDKFVNYFETKNYIFVHGWIPCEKFSKLDRPWYQIGRTLEYDPDWRNCNDVEWESARWINGIKAGYSNKILEPGKTIVCGHWHCSYGHALASARTDTLVTEFEADAIWEPFEAEGIIAIDRCTAYTGAVNILVIEDALLDEN